MFASSRPLISVVIGTYKRADDLDRAIASALASAGFLAEDQREDEVAQVAAGFRRRHGRQLREATAASGKGSGEA